MKKLICTPINKHLAMLKTEGAASSRLITNPFEMTKAYVLAAAEGKLHKFLPYSVPYELPSDDSEVCAQGWELDSWRCALTNDNCPGKVKFTSNPKLFRELVEPLDFSKPFNKGIADDIRSKFLVGSKPVEVDAVDIEEASIDTLSPKA